MSEIPLLPYRRVLVLFGVEKRLGPASLLPTLSVSCPSQFKRSAHRSTKSMELRALSSHHSRFIWVQSFRSSRFFELPTKADTGNCSVERPCLLSGHIKPPCTEDRIKRMRPKTDLGKYST